MVFSSPREGVAAALEMQRSFASEPDDEALRVRMGLHAGEAARTSTGLVGLDVHRAARIASVAHGGQVLLSESVAVLARDSLPEGTRLKDLGRHRLKDLGGPEGIFQLEASGLATDFPPLRSLDNPALPNNLPAHLANFVGREREVAVVRELVLANRLVTLTGPGGSGKTRLALQVAAELLDGTGDGVWLVELASLDDEESVPDAVASALGISLRGEGSPLEELTAALSRQKALIILDNCEHLIGGCAKTADSILRRGPENHVIATSREPLEIAGEILYRVPSLTLPPEGDGLPELRDSDAVALLVDRARSQGTEIELDETNFTLLASICRRLDGMPLAIELAAARLRSLSLSTLEARLDQRFRLLTGGSRNAAERQQTLRAAVAWSYSLLTPPERTLLNRLAVFRGGFTLEAAERICGFGDIDDFEVADLVGSLADKSLVVVEQKGDTRYRLLETIREYAAEQLADDEGSDGEEATDAHMRYFLDLAEEASTYLDGSEQAVWFRRLEVEEANLWHAMDHAAATPDGIETLLRFGKALRRAWGYLRPQLRALVRSAVENPRAEETPSLLAHALVTCCLGTRGNDAELAVRYSERALEIAKTLDDETLLLNALLARAASCYFAGRPEDGMDAGREAVERARQLGDPVMLAGSLMAFLLCADNLDPWATEKLFSEAIGAARSAGDRDLELTLRNNAAVHELRRGDLAGARVHLEEVTRLVEELSQPREHHSSLVNLGWVLWQEKEIEEARSAFLQALRIARRNGDLSGVSYSVLGLACLLAEEEGWERAAEVLGVAQAVREQAGGRWEDPESSYQEACRRRLLAELGGPSFDELFARGRINVEEVVTGLSRG